MMERIISDEQLEHIRRSAYEAGKASKEVYTSLGADGDEVIRCRDCKTYTPETIKSMDGTYGSDVELIPFCDKLRRETKPDNFCSWAERDNQ